MRQNEQVTKQAFEFEYPRVLSIAGSDSGGGAGIQADLKTFSALGCYGMTAITALTAQNTLGVRAIHGVPPQMLRDQIDAVVEDLGVDAVKIGMLHAPEIVQTVADAIDRHLQFILALHQHCQFGGQRKAQLPGNSIGCRGAQQRFKMPALLRVGGDDFRH